MNLKILTAALAIPWLLPGQSVKVAPDCYIEFNLPAAGSSPNVPNRTAGCTKWLVTYNNYGFSGLTMTFQSAPAGAGEGPGTFITFAGTTDTGSNPATATTQATGTFTGYYPFTRVTLSSTTGTGVVSGSISGWKRESASSGGGGSGDALVANPLSQFAATTSAQFAGVITNETGTGVVVLATSPALVTPDLGTPSAAVLTNATGLPIASGVSGLGTGIATALATPTSANLAAAITNETGSGALVFATSPTLVTPALGTPSAAVLTNATGLPVGGISATGTPSASNYLRGDGSWNAPAGTGGPAITVFSGLGLTLSGTQYYAIGGMVSSGTEATAQVKAPADATIQNLQAHLSAAPGTGNSVAVTWRKAGADQTVTCTIADPATDCSDTTHSFTVSQGDFLALKSVTTGTIVGTPAVVMASQLGSSATSTQLIFQGADAGGDDTYVVAPSGFPAVYATGQMVYLVVTTGNTGAAALDAGPGSKAIKLTDGTTDPSTGDLPALSGHWLRYDSTANSAAGAWILTL